MKALLRMIQMNLTGYLVPTSKDRATPRFLFGWKSKILHIIYRLMYMKSVAALISAQVPSGYYGIKVVHQEDHFFHRDIMCTLNIQHDNTPPINLEICLLALGRFGHTFAMIM